MLPSTPNGTPEPPISEPQLRDRIRSPRGVVQKNAKVLLYMAAVVLLILATLVSSIRKKPTAPAPKEAASAPLLQDNTASSVAAMHAQLASEKPATEQGSALTGTAAQQSAALAYGPNGLPVTATGCLPGQPCTATGYVSPSGQTGGGGQVQLSPAEQEAQQLAAKDKERQYAARFASNLVFSASAQQGSAPQSSGLTTNVQPGVPTNLSMPRVAGEPAADTHKRSTEVNVDAATGQPYVIYEGVTLDTVLMNRLDGDASGPVKVLVSNPVYSHDRQHVLIPEGTVVLGEAKKIGTAGFGQQRRVAVVFHRLLMPDGYSVDLDQFHGLDQIGEEGLKDKVNNHYLQIFGTSIALGVVSGAAQITEGGVGYNSTGSQAFVNGAAAGISQQATTVLDRFIQIPPTITIREGHRVKVYFTQDMLLPAYENHRIAQSF